MAPKAARQGKHVVIATAGEKVKALVPPPLPPAPPIATDGLQKAFGGSQPRHRSPGWRGIRAARHIALPLYVRPQGSPAQLPDRFRTFCCLKVRRPGVPLDDIQEVSNYVAAMNHGLARMRDGFPISLRLIREIHEILLAKGCGSTKQPGEFRKSQNWIGGTRPGNALFVPPPSDQGPDLMSDLENFIHAETPEIPTLIKAGLIHVQFGTIHPFLDGNGRVGRLLITLFLCAQGILKEPTLYLSLFLKTHRRHYYDLLQQVREKGDWEIWLAFFLEGIAETSIQAADAAREIVTLFETDRRRIEALCRPAASALRVHELLGTKPIIAIPDAAKRLAIPAPTVAKSLQHLVKIGIAREIKQRRRIFVYPGYLRIMERGTEPLSN